MPIFRKAVTEISRVVFAINAETKQESDKAFEDFFNDAKSYDDYQDYIGENTERDIDDLMTFSSEELYNNSCVRTHDFWIDATKKKDGPKETVYSVSFLYGSDDPVNADRTEYFENLTLNQLAIKLGELDKNFIVTPFDPEVFRAKDRETKYVSWVFGLKRREKDG